MMKRFILALILVVALTCKKHKREQQKNNLKKHKQVNNGGQCTILVNDFYEVCKQLNHCKMCNTNPHCGWCAGRNMCLPGGK